MKFRLESKYKPAGDQPKAIEKLTKGLQKNIDQQTLLGVTGSGKTFTMANVIQKLNKPTLIISHNKSLAAQLYEEFKLFFPHNAVGFFVSYYDYYQPESYIKQTDTYIEKEIDINHQIEQYRMEAVSNLVSRDDVIVIASVSCIYGLGDPRSFTEFTLTIKEGDTIDRQEFIRSLIERHYERNDTDVFAGKFRVRGDIVDLIQGYGKNMIRIEFFGDEIERITSVHPASGKTLGEMKEVLIFPANPFIFTGKTKEQAISSIEKELKETLPKLDLIESHRLEQRTNYDIEMIKELGYCKGIENYSRHFENRKPGEPANTLMDFFPDDFILMIDESHVTLPQVHGMYNGDRSRKQNLIENGFRLPSAYDNRPLKFDEFEKYLKNVIYVSATPGDYEIEKSKQVVEQIIRPTGLVDPPIDVRPTEGQIDDLIKEIHHVVEKGHRVLVTTLTKRMSEELNNYLLENNIRSHYLHSEIDTIERIEILKDLRLGKFDVLVGINLLREGLDLPEVALVAILDADKEGFLRTSRSLIQTIGRAARNVDSQVIMYGDSISKAMKKAITETNRRRSIQMKYNKKNNIVPQTIIKSVQDTEIPGQGDGKKKRRPGYNKHDEVVRIEAEMQEAAERLDFEKAIDLREQLKQLRGQLDNS